MSTLPSIAQCTPFLKQYIPQGISGMTAFITSVVAFLVGGGLAWYVKGRGMAGVQIDLNNVKTDVNDLKAKFSAPTASVVV